jgi:protein-S-isoprenylcysteine O-methyltransferase Ste14
VATIIAQIVGGILFVAGTIVLGFWLRRHPGKREAERASRISQLFFWLALVLPSSIGVAFPGLTRYDELLGLPSVPASSAWLVAGSVALVAGLTLSFASQAALRRQGRGANAFRLTKVVTAGSAYAHTRNPMSLGFYLICLGLGLIARSTYVILGTLLGIIPAHIFYLKFFEEYELALRLGERYLAYKRRVPFLLPRLTTGTARSPKRRA